MFAGGRRRPIPGAPQPTAASTGTQASATTARPATSSSTRLTPVAGTPHTTKPTLSGPSSSSSSPLKRPSTPSFITTTTTTVRKVVQPKSPFRAPAPQPADGRPRSVNKYRPPTPPPAPPAEPKSKAKSANGGANGRKGKKSAPAGSRSASSDHEGDSPRPKKRSRPSPPAASTSRGNGRAPEISSDLDPLTPSEEEGPESESELSSADEDYSSRSLKRQDGAPVAVRDPSARPTAPGKGPPRVTSAESLVLQNPSAYRPYFIDPSDPARPASEWAGSEIPTVELEYPGEDGRERFALLAARSEDEYNPIEDVMTVILTVLEFFLTPEQAQEHFGFEPEKQAFAAFLGGGSNSQRGASSSGKSRQATPTTGLAAPPTTTVRQENPGAGEVARASVPPEAQTPAAAASGDSASRSATAVPATAPNTFPAPPPADTSEPLLRQLRKARAQADGPAFLSALARYNLTLSRLKQAGVLRDNIARMRGLKEKVWTRVFTQCYDRTVGPGLEDVKQYKAFSDNVYGELLPKFMNEIFARTHLGPKSVFVDLGSGVGNCVVSAALATGAEAWGFENMPGAAKLADAQVAEADERFRLWGLAGGAMQVREANFLESREVVEVLRRTDVVLVNNEVFTSPLNNALSLLFLELRDTTKVVSLKPFLPSSFTLSSHNVDSPAAILAQSRHAYGENCVSWKSVGGEYFVARIDRGRLRRFLEREGERKSRVEGVRRERRERREGSATSSASGGGSGGGGGGGGAGSRPASRAGSVAAASAGMSRTTSRQGSNLAKG